MNRKLKFKPKAPLKQVKPLSPSELTLDKLPKYSNKQLLVTAMALNKKARFEKDEAQKDAMNKIAYFIGQVVNGRRTAAQMQQGANYG